jgi:hypothetical protein
VTTPGVDFFRIDRSGSTRRLLVLGVFLVTGGASAVGAHLVRRLPTDVSHVVSLLGGLSMAAGLVLTFGALAMVLFENVYLAIHDDHLLLHDNGRETRIAWDELTAVNVDAKQGYVELRRERKDALRWHAGKSAKDVAARIAEAKRKAAHGLRPNDS